METKTHAVTMENFESIVDSHPLVVLDFWAAWCAPCRTFAPIFEQTAEIFPDIYFGKVDIEAAPELAEAFQVRSVPTIMAFRNTELIFEQSGLLHPEQFAEMIAQLRLS